tara:strand:- start:76 stop:945 length:870 start_codon:yes stop_codon:yes gene_type:complete
MRLSKYLLLTILFPSIAFAQALPIRNDTPTALRDLGANLNVGRNFAVDSFGRTQCILPAGTAGTSSVLPEDTLTATAQPMSVTGGINNRALAAQNSTSLDATIFATGDTGAILSSLVYDSSVTAADNAIVKEDSVAATAQAGITVFGVLQSAISSDAAAGDNGVFKADTGGRQINTLAPAGETWQGCGTATASTADVAIKASVASNRIYVTSITCKNTSATTATSLDFKDATTVIAVGGISALTATVGDSFVATFNPPLRGTSATAFNFATNVSVSSVTCCAAGYISTI